MGELKPPLYEQVTHVSKVLAGQKRLELTERLCQRHRRQEVGVLA